MLDILPCAIFRLGDRIREQQNYVHTLLDPLGSTRQCIGKGVVVLAGHVCSHPPNSDLGFGILGIEMCLSHLWAAVIEYIGWVA